MYSNIVLDDLMFETISQFHLTGQQNHKQREKLYKHSKSGHQENTYNKFRVECNSFYLETWTILD